MATWINFKELRARLDFEKILQHYNVEVKRKGTQHQGFCPLPKHVGKRNSPSFSANLERGIFHCFGCGAKGNLLEFAALMEGVDLENGAAFRTLAIELESRFCPQTKSFRASCKPVVEARLKQGTGTITILNGPLDFELKGLDANHQYLLSRQFLPETIAHFGLGFCSRGLLKDRIAIPLMDQNGKLIGYAGRVIDDKVIAEDNPRYRFPAKRERQGKVFEFRKSLFLYNGYRMVSPLDDLIVVEGFASVWWLHQHGFPNVVATMGADCSPKQGELVAGLVKRKGRVWIVPDGDEAGERFAKAAFTEIAPHRSVRWVKLPQNSQPTDLSPEELKSCFTQ